MEFSSRQIPYSLPLNSNALPTTVLNSNTYGNAAWRSQTGHAATLPAGLNAPGWQGVP